MKTKPLLKDEKGELKRNEWLFLKTPKNEIKACFAFEYAREVARKSLRVSELLSIWKAGQSARKGTSESKKANKALIDLVRIMRACFPEFLVVFDDRFPDTPWRDLGRELRLGMMDYQVQELQDKRSQRRSERLSIDLSGVFDSPEMNFITFQHLHECLSHDDFSQNEYGLIAINWSYPIRELKQAFDDWVEEESENRKARGLVGTRRKEKTGRGGFPFLDRLNRLGALRLVNRYRWKELPNYTRKKDNTYCYGGVRELRDGAAKARELLDTLLNRIG